MKKTTLSEHNLFLELSEEEICKRSNLTPAYKIYLLSLKRGYDISDQLELRKNNIVFEGLKIMNAKASVHFCIQIIEMKENLLQIEGYTNLGILKSWSVYAKNAKGKLYKPELFPMPTRDRYAPDGTKIFEGTGFRFELPLQNGNEYTFLLKKDHEKRELVLSPKYGKYAKLTNGMKSSYFAGSRYILTTRDNKILVSTARKKTLLKTEWNYLKELVGLKEIKLAATRLAALLFKLFLRKKIWIISDRSHLAGDNGEYLFKYIQKEKPQGVKAYFLLDANSRDFTRMKTAGPVLKKDSFLYQCLFLCSDKIISSGAEGWTTNAFGEKEKYMSNMYAFSFVFLQHGIGMNDMSRYLNKQEKNIKLLVTTTKPEYDSFFKYAYYYDDNAVKLTGLPRYDYLKNESEKKIVFLPTWRRSLSGPTVKWTSKRTYNEDFKSSEYYQYYNALIHNEKLLEVMKTHGYKGEFYVHPSAGENAKDFQGNDVINVLHEAAKYNKVFKTGALLITDYSSVAFDFSYLKKPVIYTQFDKEFFFASQIFEEGYFSFDEHGFGPVCTNLDDTVSSICEYIKNECKMPELFQDRVNSFFTYTDQNNCKRVLAEILNMN